MLAANNVNRAPALVTNHACVHDRSVLDVLNIAYCILHKSHDTLREDTIRIYTMSQGQGQQNSSSGIEVAYYSGAIVFGSVALWYAYSAYIVYYTFSFTWYQGYALLVPIDFINQQIAQWFPMIQLPDYLTGNRIYATLTEIERHATMQSASKVSVSDWLRVLGVVGEYLMLVASPLWLFASFYLFTHSITGRFKDKYSMEKFRELESTNWPAICTALGKNYAKIDLDTGDFAMSMQPMTFAKKFNLLDVEQIEGKTVATVNRAVSYTHLTLPTILLV